MTFLGTCARFEEEERGSKGVAARVWGEGGRRPAPSYIEGGEDRVALAPSPSLSAGGPWGDLGGMSSLFLLECSPRVSLGVGRLGSSGAGSPGPLG
jgi:hypothetical protein